jgi:hypothetical protein
MEREGKREGEREREGERDEVVFFLLGIRLG